MLHRDETRRCTQSSSSTTAGDAGRETIIDRLDLQRNGVGLYWIGEATGKMKAVLFLFSMSCRLAPPSQFFLAGCAGLKDDHVA